MTAFLGHHRPGGYNWPGEARQTGLPEGQTAEGGANPPQAGANPPQAGGKSASGRGKCLYLGRGKPSFSQGVGKSEAKTIQTITPTGVL